MDTLSDDTTRAANPPSRRPIDFRRIGLVWTILLLPIEIGAAVYDPQLFTSGYASVVMFTIFDIPLLLLAAGALLPTIQRIRSRDVSLGTGLTLVLFVAGLASFVFHPSPSGVGLLIRLALLVIVAFEVSGLDRERLRRRVGGPLLIGSSIQGVIGLAQVINGGALGLGGRGERSVFTRFCVRLPSGSSLGGM